MRAWVTVLCALLAGALGGNLVALVDWRRLLLNGDFTAPVFLNRIWIAAVLFGALCGLAAGLVALVVRLLLPAEWRRAVDRLTGSRKTLALLLALLILCSAVTRLVLPWFEGRSPLQQLEREIELAEPVPAGVGEGPPVILLVLDTVRADHLSCYGYHRDTTPHLEILARDATVFERVWSSASWTIPAHATLFTGLYPHQHGVYRFVPEVKSRTLPMHTYPLARETITLASHLSRAGYRTAAFTANPILNSRSNLHRGFQLFHHSRNLNSTMPLVTEPLQKQLFGEGALTAFHQQTMTARQVNQRVSHWLERFGSRPFFLFVNYMDAHSPYNPDPPFDRFFPGTWDRFPEWHSYTLAMRHHPRAVTGQEREHMHALYDGAIRSLDDQLGWLIDWLKERGLYRDSLIIVTSDHGEHFGEHGLLEHSVDVYEEVLRVPLLVKYPGESPGRRVAEPVNLVDILPTALDTVGLAVPAGVAGSILGAGGRDDILLNESYDPRQVPREQLKPGETPGRKIRTRRSIHLDRMKFIWSSDQEHELYDLETDPGESTNLLEGDPRLAEPFLAMAEEIEANRFIPEPGEESAVMDPELRRHLEELGYVD